MAGAATARQPIVQIRAASAPTAVPRGFLRHCDGAQPPPPDPFQKTLLPGGHWHCPVPGSVGTPGGQARLGTHCAGPPLPLRTAVCPDGQVTAAGAGTHFTTPGFAPSRYAFCPGGQVTAAGAGTHFTTPGFRPSRYAFWPGGHGVRAWAADGDGWPETAGAIQSVVSAQPCAGSRPSARTHAPTAATGHVLLRAAMPGFYSCRS